MKEFICANCGKQFKDYPSNRIKGSEHCCSKKCKGEYQTSLAIMRSPVKSYSSCNICGCEKPITGFYKDNRCRANGYIQYTCKECTKTIRKNYYDNNIEDINNRVRAYKKLHPGRKGPYTKHNRAQRLLNYALERGLIEKPNCCSECGKVGRLHGHHYDGYEDPYKVNWLCPSCHHAAHGRGPKARLALKV